MIVYKLSEIAGLVGGKAEGNTGLLIDDLLIDSRTASVSENMLFFSLTGPHHDGHQFVTDLYNRGVRAFVVNKIWEEYRTLPDAGFIVTGDTLRVLQTLAGYHRSRFQCPVVAITGSNGKTIVKEWLNHCLSGDYRITRSPKSFNSQVGVPLSLWLLNEQSDLAIFEAGISQPGEMENLNRMIRPNVGLFTNIGEAHQENFTDLRQKVKEKLALFAGCRVLVYCKDHAMIREEIAKNPLLQGTQRVTWSLGGEADVRISAITPAEDRTRFTAVHGSLRMELEIPWSDDASLENAFHCLALMLVLKIRPEIIAGRMRDLPSIAMRFEQKSAIHGCTLINDSYNTDVHALSVALDLLNRQNQHPKKTLILSDILQSGQTREELYSRVAKMVHSKGISRMIGVGQALMESASCFDIPCRFYESTESFLSTFNEDDFRNEAILLKGARKFEFEKIAQVLELKKHTSRVEVNLNALVHNLNYFRSRLNPGTKIMVMVKAVSYGSGRHEIANVLEFNRVNYLGVAFSDEGIALRQAGITLPVLVMNPEPESFDSMIRYKLEPEIYSFRILDLFHQAVLRNQEIGYPIHLKVDTGMHRLGFCVSDVQTLTDRIKQIRNLRVTSVFSHLAGSDEDRFDKFTKQQIRLFSRAANQIRESLGYDVIRHILNSSGIERFPEAQFEMVRLGIGLYGISATDPDKLRPVSTFKTTILQLKEVSPGETVGYSRKGKIEKPSVIAVIPVGYADGVNRRLSNGVGKFWINGNLAPVVGNICMDMTMLDVTGLDVSEGDEVILFGDPWPATHMAEALQTIPYEIFASISERVSRIYLYE